MGWFPYDRDLHHERVDNMIDSCLFLELAHIAQIFKKTFQKFERKL